MALEKRNEIKSIDVMNRRDTSEVLANFDCLLKVTC